MTHNADALLSDAERALIVDKSPGGEDTEGWEYALLCRTVEGVVRERMARAWDEGAAKASPHGGAYLRSLYAENPYRTTHPVEEQPR